MRPGKFRSEFCGVLRKRSRERYINMKTMNSSASLVNLKVLIAIFLVMPIAGCVVVKDTSMESRTEKVLCSDCGPGSDDGVFYQISRNKYKSDSGSRISIGIFPGLWDPPRTQDLHGRRAATHGESMDWTSFLAWSLVENIFCVGIPTVASLLYGPFPSSEDSILTRGGIVGAHRWREAENSEFEKREDEELVLSCLNHENAKVTFDGKPIVGSDGIALYVGYPGFDNVYSAVMKSGKVDVLHDSQTKVRRFTKSSLDSSLLAYEDRGVGEDAVIRKYIVFRSGCADIRRRAGELKTCYAKFDLDDCLGSVVSEIDKRLLVETEKGAWFDQVVARIEEIESKYSALAAKVESNKKESEDKLKQGDWAGSLEIAMRYINGSCYGDDAFWANIVWRSKALHVESEVKKLHDYFLQELAKKPQDFGAVWETVSSWPNVEGDDWRVAIDNEKAACFDGLAEAQLQLLHKHLLAAKTNDELDSILNDEFKGRRWLYDYSIAYEGVRVRIDTWRHDREIELYKQFCETTASEIDKISRESLHERMQSARAPYEDITKVDRLFELTTYDADKLWQCRAEFFKLISFEEKPIMMIAGSSARPSISFKVEDDNPIVLILSKKLLLLLCDAIPVRMSSLTENEEVGIIESLVEFIESMEAYTEPFVSKESFTRARDAVKLRKKEMAEEFLKKEEAARKKRESERIESLERQVRESKAKIEEVEEELDRNPIRAHENFKPMTVTLKGRVLSIKDNPEFRSQLEKVLGECAVSARDELLLATLSGKSVVPKESNAFARNLVNADFDTGISFIRDAMSKEVEELMIKKFESEGKQRVEHKYMVEVQSGENIIAVGFAMGILDSVITALNIGDSLYVTGQFDSIEDVGNRLRRCLSIEPASK